MPVWAEITPLEPDPVGTGGGRRDNTCRYQVIAAFPLLEIAAFVFSERMGQLQEIAARGPWCTYVTDPELTPRQQREVIWRFVDCSVDQDLRVAFRLPGLSDLDVSELLEWYLQLIEGSGVRMLPPLVHDRDELAMWFPGVGLWRPSRLIGIDSPAPENRWIAASVHSVAEAHEAIRHGAREVIYGHLYATASHPGVPPRGLEDFHRIAAKVQRSRWNVVITGIGGITAQHAEEIGKEGMVSIAMIRAISQSSDIATTLRELRQSWLSTFGRVEVDGVESSRKGIHIE